MHNTKDQWEEYVVFQFSQVRRELEDVRDEYDKHFKKVPFVAYIPVVQFFLRKTELDVSSTDIKCKGRALIIEMKAPKGSDYDPVCMKIDKTSVSYYSIVSTELTPEEVDLKRTDEWNKYCKNHGFDKEDLGREFEWGSQKFKIVGCKNRKQTFGIRCYSYDEDRIVCVKTAVVAAALKKGIDL